MQLKQKLYCETTGCKMACVVKEILRTKKERFSEKEIELTIEQFFILNILDNNNGLILRELAEIVDRDKSAVLRHIDGLEQNNFVTRVTDPEDKRRKSLLVTKQGLQVLEKARAVDDELNDTINKQLHTISVEQLDTALSNIFEFLVCKD